MQHDVVLFAFHISLKMAAAYSSETPVKLYVKNAVFWDVAPRGFIINRRFGERVTSIFKVEDIS
jgi:hypothetical protein